MVERAGGGEVRAMLALRAGVSTEPDWAGICGRCVDALAAQAVVDLMTRRVQA